MPKFAVQFSTRILLVLHGLSVLELVLVNTQPDGLQPSFATLLAS
jgi:hypothetical protein